MRTSHLQYVMMVEFMESHGDLSKPSGGPRGRHFIQTKWKELTNKLNNVGTEDPRSEDKWRKVWSDFKNNIKKKRGKITKAACSTGGGRALQLSLTDLEERVIQIIGLQAGTGMVVEETRCQQDKASEISEAQPAKSLSEDPGDVFEIDWNIPGTSTQPVPPPPPVEALPRSPTAAPVDKEWRPPQKKTKKYLTKIYIDSDKKAREYARDCDREYSRERNGDYSRERDSEYARERDREYYELEKERLRIKAEELRVRDFEVKERVRQRDVELRLQAQWQELMKEAMEVVVRYIEKKS